MSGRFSPFQAFSLVSIFTLLPLFLAAQPAQTASEQKTATTTTADRSVTAETYVNERLAVWQKRLKLDDWHINIIMSHPSSLKPRTLGNIHWDADKKSAVIRVLDASDYKLAFRDMLDDMEFTVVHELIHLELSSLPRSEASRRDEEYAVNQIADALLKLDRGR
jgi:hypothetical protein